MMYPVLKKKLPVLLLFFMLFSLSSCFEIVDEINLNEDGSGEMILTCNLSKSKSKIASIMLMDSINGHKVPQKEDIERILSQAVDYLKKEKGITNISKKADYENYIFSISCHFSSLNNINNVLREITGKQKVKTLSTSYAFDQQKSLFSRSHIYHAEAKKQYNSLKEEDRKIFNEASYTAIYRFKDEVVSFSNSQAKLSKSKKALMLKIPALALIRGEVSLANQIQLKK